VHLANKKKLDNDCSPRMTHTTVVGLRG